MKEERKSYDGGFSENIFFTDKYEEDFIESKGAEQWNSYRENWEKCSRLEIETKYPSHLELELNYSCNLRCPMCTWSTETTVEKKEDWFTFEDYKKLIKEAVSKGTKSIRLCYINEPLIRQDIDQFIKYASDVGILDIIITTNGTLLTKEMSKKLIESGLTKINLSLDAITEETYEKIRVGGDLKTTVKNIHDFMEIRKNMKLKLPKLRLSFVRSKINDHEYEQFIDYWKDKVDSLGAQTLLDPFGDGKFKNSAKKDEIALKNTKPPPKKFYCPEPFKRMTLRGNGDVLGCCSFYAVDLVMGNWKKESLDEIWNGEKMKKLREMHKNGDYSKNPACKSCIENVSYISD